MRSTEGQTRPPLDLRSPSPRKTLTSPVQSKEVRPTYVHRSKSGSTETKKSDYEIFIEFHQSKQKRQVPENVTETHLIHHICPLFAGTCHHSN